MKRSVQFIGMLGLVALVFGLISASLALDESGWFSLAHLGVAACALLWFFVRGGVSLLGGAAWRRAAGYGVGVSLYSTLFLALIVALNVYVYRHDPFHLDSTEEKVFTLSPQTQKVLARLERPVMIRAFYLGGQVDATVKELLDRIKRASSQVEWRVVDPEKDPRATEQYGINERDTLHFSFADGSSEREAKIVRDIDEQSVVNALLKLTRGGAKKIYWIDGHGEANLDDETEAGFLFLKEAIQGENLQVERLTLAAAASVPTDADALLLMAPRKELLPRERETLDAYLKSGGNMLLLHEPNATRDVAEIVKPLGIEVGEDIILDQVLQLFTGPKIGVQPVVSRYATHPATEDFSQNTIFSTVSSVRALPGSSGVVELAFTGEGSWAEKDVASIFSENPTVELPDESMRGAVPIAAAFQGPLAIAATDAESSQETASEASTTQELPVAPEPEVISVDAETSAALSDEEAPTAPSADAPPYAGRVLVIGDADFVANVNIRQLFNRDFFLNSLNWVLGEQERISIRERTLRSSTESLSPEQFQKIFLLGGVLLPELVLVWGLAVWWSRRR